MDNQINYENIGDQLTHYMLEKYSESFGQFLGFWKLLLKNRDEIKTWPCTDPQLIEEKEKVLGLPLVFRRKLVETIGGIPALVEFEKPGEGLLKNCTVTPTKHNSSNNG